MKPNRALLLSAFLLAIDLDSSALGQPVGVDNRLGDYEVTTWNESDGVPAGRIRAIRQDDDGYLWLATDAGLVRFDGVRFDRWALKQSALPAGASSALLTSRDGGLWIGLSGSSPVGRLRNRKLTLYGASEGLGVTYVSSLIEDREGTIWAGTPRGLFYFREERWAKAATDGSIDDASVLAVYEDGDGHLWAGTHTAVFRKAPNTKHFEQVDVINVSSNVWQSFGEDASGTVWITDFKEGLRRPGAAPLPMPRRGWGVDLLRDRRGNLWVGTQGQGLWRVRDGPGPAERTVDAITIADGLASNAVQSLWEDRDGNIWLGTLAGLQRLTPHLVTPVRNLAIPRAIAATKDGSVWVGTAAGLTQFSSAGRRDYTEADGLKGSLVMALHPGNHGDLWISTEGGLARFSEERFSQVLIRPGEQIERIVAIAELRGDLWLRDFKYQLFRWTGHALKVPDHVPAPYRTAAMAVFADSRGHLWIGSLRGQLVVLDEAGAVRSQERLGIGRIARIFESADGTMWVGGDDGLSHLADGRWVTVTGKNGFPGGVRSIVEDTEGLIWIGSTMGVLRLERGEVAKVAGDPGHQLKFRLFNSADGAAGVPFGDAVRSEDGRLWFVTSSGVTLVDPRTVGDPRPAPGVRIEAVTADTHAFDPDPQLRLPPRTSHLQFAFTALTLSDPTRVRFRYRLDGFDRDWVDGGTVRLASYTNLPPREYRFQVVASGGDGAWSVPDTLTFRIAPTFYQTNWFYGASAGAAFLVVYTSWRFRVRQVRREFELVLGERVRMSRAIHDTLLQGLAALALQVDDIAHELDHSSPGRNRAVRIRRQAEQYIRQTRQSIWLLRSPTLTSRDLPRALRDAAEHAVADRPVALNVTVCGTPRAYDPAVEEQVLMIGQEAVNNAVRHAGARRVAVELDYRDEQMRLRVIDDGCGFDPEAAGRLDDHYGLTSMRERADLVRARFTIASEPGRGTEIETVIPVAAKPSQKGARG